MTRTLVLGLGNDLLADDAAGVLAARCLRETLDGVADVIESAESGVPLLEHVIDYDRLVIVDSICTGQYPPGTILKIAPSELKPIHTPSPHHAGLAELMVLAREMNLKFPHDIAIFAIEVKDPYTIDGPMTGSVLEAIPCVVKKVTEWVVKTER